MINHQMNWVEVHDLIKEMIQKLETQKTVTRTISRINYSELLGVLRNHTILQHDRNINLKVNVQDGIISIQMRRKK